MCGGGAGGGAGGDAGDPEDDAGASAAGDVGALESRMLAILEREGPATLSAGGGTCGDDAAVDVAADSVVGGGATGAAACGSADRRTICLRSDTAGKKLLQAVREQDGGTTGGVRMNELEDQEIAELWRTMPLLLKLAGEESAGRL